MSVRGPVNVVPLELFGLTSASIAIAQRFLPYRLVDAVNAPILRLRFGDLGKSRAGRSENWPADRHHRKGRTPLINIGTIERIRSGDIRVFPAIFDIRGSAGAFLRRPIRYVLDAIILAIEATGRELDAAPARFRSDVAAPTVPPADSFNRQMTALYFCGFTAVPTGLLREIGIEAEDRGLHR